MYKSYLACTSTLITLQILTQSGKRGIFNNCIPSVCRYQLPRGLRRSSAAARLLRLWVRISQGSWTFVCWEHCVLSSGGLCDELITRPEESCRLWCFVVCDLETSGTISLKASFWPQCSRGGGGIGIFKLHYNTLNPLVFLHCDQ